MSFLKHRILSFALVLSVGFLLMVSLVISAVLGTLHMYLDARLAAAAFFWSGLDLVISFTLATVMIAMMFKYLPDAEIEWRDTWLGALITAALFIVGKQVIGLYLGQTTVASSFGAAASVVIFMIWVYYAALILLFGAEITQAVAARRGAIVVPMENAEPAPAPAAKPKGLAARGDSVAPLAHSKLKMSSPSGRSIPASWYSSQIFPQAARTCRAPCTRRCRPATPASRGRRRDRTAASTR